MQTGETANLSVLDGHEIVYLVRSNSPRIISIGFHAGARAPAHVVSPGYAMLSTFEPTRLDEWIAAHDFAKFTQHTITDEADFREAVALARHLGYALVSQYIDVGLCGMALPLLDRKGRCLGALSTTYQAQSYPRKVRSHGCCLRCRRPPRRSARWCELRAGRRLRRCRMHRRVAAGDVPEGHRWAQIDATRRVVASHDAGHVRAHGA